MIIKIIKNLNSAPRRTKLPRPALCAHTMYMQRRKKDPWNCVWNAGCKGLIATLCIAVTPSQGSLSGSEARDESDTEFVFPWRKPSCEPTLCVLLREMKQGQVGSKRGSDQLY